MLERIAGTGMQNLNKKTIYKTTTFKIFFHYGMSNVLLGYVSLMKCRMKVDERGLQTPSIYTIYWFISYQFKNVLYQGNRRKNTFSLGSHMKLVDKQY
jgi:hypothetical protein